MGENGGVHRGVRSPPLRIYTHMYAGFTHPVRRSRAIVQAASTSQFGIDLQFYLGIMRAIWSWLQLPIHQRAQTIASLGDSSRGGSARTDNGHRGASFWVTIPPMARCSHTHLARTCAHITCTWTAPDRSHPANVAITNTKHRRSVMPVHPSPASTRSKYLRTNGSQQPGRVSPPPCPQSRWPLRLPCGALLTPACACASPAHGYAPPDGRRSNELAQAGMSSPTPSPPPCSQRLHQRVSCVHPACCEGRTGLCQASHVCTHYVRWLGSDSGGDVRRWQPTLSIIIHVRKTRCIHFLASPRLTSSNAVGAPLTASCNWNSSSCPGNAPQLLPKSPFRGTDANVLFPSASARPRTGRVNRPAGNLARLQAASQTGPRLSGVPGSRLDMAFRPDATTEHILSRRRRW